MAWRRSGDKPLSEPMLLILLTHKCVKKLGDYPHNGPVSCKVYPCHHSCHNVRYNKIQNKLVNKICMIQCMTQSFEFNHHGRNIMFIHRFHTHEAYTIYCPHALHLIVFSHYRSYFQALFDPIYLEESIFMIQKPYENP